MKKRQRRKLFKQMMTFLKNNGFAIIDLKSIDKNLVTYISSTHWETIEHSLVDDQSGCSVRIEGTYSGDVNLEKMFERKARFNQRLKLE
ncbi:hypothetical protein [Latilactobacillus sakei]|uniref:hypothetical protein n=1 Tax=Latilactobacillus sakei TaxID=1599 RepID=UPI000704BE96|nr:hypothetical protein [Latilactobacillus sakei]MCP8851768.1 hypothetical protein [Latilactobacillus sakei]GEP21122.1 hypothetical protein LSA03nite_07100 [Latilactobacillus sakei subsp. carnosus]